MLKRLLLALVLYQVCRLIFLVFNYHYFPNSFFEFVKVFILGIRFDVSAVVYSNIVFIVLSILPVFRLLNSKTYQLVLTYLFFLVNSIALMTNLMDAAYFEFSNKRSTADILNVISTGGDFFTMLPQYISDYWVLTLSFFVLAYLLIKNYPKHTKVNILKTSYRKLHLRLLIFSLTIATLFISARGVELKPLRIINAAEYTHSRNIPLVLNTPFALIRTFDKKDLVKRDYLSETIIDELYSPIINSTSVENIKKDNVVIIILESFSKEYIGELNNNKGYTPFLDSLMKHSLVFTNTYANAQRSIEALPAIFSSIPPLMDNSYVSSNFSGNQIYSIANLLKAEGYNSSFFHGGINGTMGFDNFTAIAGIEDYYGKDEYPNKNHYDGNWGIYDEEYLGYFADKLNSFEEPFFSSVFTLSSHHPYKIPSKYKGKFKGGNLKIHGTIEYADYSLSKFFEKVSKMDWYDNTLFVITADHTSMSASRYYKTKTGSYAIPLMFYHPGDSLLVGESNIVTQQTDIMPSVLDYLNYKGEYIAFGKSVFDSLSTRSVMNYNNGIYQIIQNQYTLLFNGEESISLYDYKNDSLLKRNVLEDSMNVAIKLEDDIKAIIQVYNDRMISNKMVLRK